MRAHSGTSPPTRSVPQQQRNFLARPLLLRAGCHLSSTPPTKANPVEAVFTQETDFTAFEIWFGQKKFCFPAQRIQRRNFCKVEQLANELPPPVALVGIETILSLNNLSTCMYVGAAAYGVGKEGCVETNGMFGPRAWLGPPLKSMALTLCSRGSEGRGGGNEI